MFNWTARVCVVVLAFVTVYSMEEGGHPLSPSDLDPPALQPSGGKRGKDEPPLVIQPPVATSRPPPANQPPVFVPPPANQPPVFVPPPANQPPVFAPPPVTVPPTSTPTSAAQLEQFQTDLQEMGKISRNLESAISRFSAGLSLESSQRAAAFEELSAELSAVENTRSQTVRTEDPIIAFSATVSEAHENLTIHDTIRFGITPTNLGGAYDPMTGKFRAPVKGLYHFWLTITNYPYDRVLTEIAVNGRAAVINVAGGEMFGDPGSNAINLVLNPGDEVWVRIHNSEGGNVSQWWSNFSGYLVKTVQ